MYQGEYLNIASMAPDWEPGYAAGRKPLIPGINMVQDKSTWQ
jgi:hypothetical protein